MTTVSEFLAQSDEFERKSFTLSPPNNTLDDYAVVAQKYANQRAEVEGKGVLVLAKFNGVRPLAGGADYVTEKNFLGQPTTPATTEKVTTPSQTKDDPELAKRLAEEKAANTNKAATVTVNNSTVTAQPPPRPTDINSVASGSPPDVVPQEARQAAREAITTMSLRNCSKMDEDTEAPGSVGPGNPKYNINQLFGAARNRIANIAPMEALMHDVPNSALGKVLGLLPPIFKSLMPLGSILGITSKLPIPIGGITNLLGGAALGAVAGQAIRGAGGIGSISGVSGILGGIALTGAIGQARGGSIMNPSTSATLSTVIGTAARLALVKQATGIPVGTQVLGLAAGIALKSFGTGLAIPTNVLGVPGSTGLTSITNILGASVSGRIPILPTNLSLPGITSLNGMSQNLSPGLAENLIPRNQMSGLLPGNIQNQVQTAVPPRVTSGEVNDVQQRRQQAPDQAPDPVPTGAKPDEKQPLLTGRVNGRIPYEMKASDGGITLGQMSATATPWKYQIVDMPVNSRTTDQIIYNLSWIAQNLLDPIKAQFPGMIITNGFRNTTSSSSYRTDHGHGAACDLSWGNGNSRKHYEICQWIVQHNLPFKQLLLEGSRTTDWVHVAGGPYAKKSDYGAAKIMTSWDNGGTFNKGLIARA